jgi:hypothetical protein
MTQRRNPTAHERAQYEAAVDRFTDLLARLIAREHVRRSANSREESETNKREPSRLESKSPGKRQIPKDDQV